MDEYLTTRDVAQTLKVNILTVRRWIHANKLQAVNLGTDYRIRRIDFEKFIADRKAGK